MAEAKGDTASGTATGIAGLDEITRGGLDAGVLDRGAGRIVFDAIDRVLSLLPDAASIRHQVN